jgi:chromosome partitioning protein
MKITAIVNHKGGVGKTTTTLNLGKALSVNGKKVLLIDLDPQANLSQSLGYREPEQTIYQILCENEQPKVIQVTENYDLIPADLSLSLSEHKLRSEEFAGYTKLKKTLQDVAKNYDYILIDCPPSLGILTMNALAFANQMLIVAEPEYLSITGLQNILDLHQSIIEGLNPNVEFRGILFTQFNREAVSKGIMDSVKQKFGDKVFNTVIRQNVKIKEASLNKKDIFSYDETSNGAIDYMEFSKEFLNHD